MKSQFIRYNPKLKGRARQLRNNSTLSEVLLWKELKGKQMMGYDFHRQRPIDRFIVDFYCPRLRLAIEIDGDSHFMQEKKDAERQQRLERFDVRFLPFDDLDVKFQMEKVLNTIREWIQQHEVEIEQGGSNTPLLRGEPEGCVMKRYDTHTPTR
jgi:very-short-patch-repair endonuclease